MIAAAAAPIRASMSTASSIGNAGRLPGAVDAVGTGWAGGDATPPGPDVMPATAPPATVVPPAVADAPFAAPNVGPGVTEALGPALEPRSTPAWTGPSALGPGVADGPVVPPPVAGVEVGALAPGKTGAPVGGAPQLQLGCGVCPGIEGCQSTGLQPVGVTIWPGQSRYPDGMT